MRQLACRSGRGPGKLQVPERTEASTTGPRGEACFGAWLRMQSTVGSRASQIGQSAWCCWRRPAPLPPGRSRLIVADGLPCSLDRATVLAWLAGGAEGRRGRTGPAASSNGRQRLWLLIPLGSMAVQATAWGGRRWPMPLASVGPSAAEGKRGAGRSARGPRREMHD